MKSEKIIGGEIPDSGQHDGKEFRNIEIEILSLKKIQKKCV